MNPGLSTMQGLGNRMDLGIMLAMPGFGSAGTAIPMPMAPAAPPKPTTSISQASENIIENVYSMLDRLVVQTLSAKDAASFDAVVERVFPHYLQMAHGLSQILATAEPDSLGELGETSFSKMETFFETRGLNAFGSDVQSQAIFTIWTLKKISSLCQQINVVPVREECKPDDLNLWHRFVITSMRATFFLDCLGKSIVNRKPFAPDILPVLVEGLRSAVNAYAYARQALDLRVPINEVETDVDSWDDEDEFLLKSAMIEMIPEPL